MGPEASRAGSHLLPAGPPEGAQTPPALTGFGDLKASADINQLRVSGTVVDLALDLPWRSPAERSGGAGKATPVTLCSGSWPPRSQPPCADTSVPARGSPCSPETSWGGPEPSAPVTPARRWVGGVSHRPGPWKHHVPLHGTRGPERLNRKMGPVWYRLVTNQRRVDLILAWAKCPLHPSATLRAVSRPSRCAVSHRLRRVGLRGQAKPGEPACCLPGCSAGLSSPPSARALRRLFSNLLPCPCLGKAGVSPSAPSPG